MFGDGAILVFLNGLRCSTIAVSLDHLAGFGEYPVCCLSRSRSRLMTNRLYKWGDPQIRFAARMLIGQRAIIARAISWVSFALVRLAEPLPTVFKRHALLPLVSFVFSSSCSRSQQSQRWMSPFSSPLPHNFGIQTPFSTHLIPQMLSTLNRSFPCIISMIPKRRLWTVYWNQNIITQSWNSTKTSTSR